MSDRYSLSRRDKKVAGVAANLGEIFNIDPTFLRIGFVAIAILVSWKLAIIAYIGSGIYLHMQKTKANRTSANRDGRLSDFERMDQVGRVRPSVHAMRTELDETDRRMMAIDHHIQSQKDHELAREIEALREEK
jgi:phage shock protein PspC (stress-responsive transcriptional regulator)